MCTIFGVPRITLAELRDMLRDGTMGADLEKWVKRMTTDFRIVSAGINPRPGLIPAKHNFFVSVSGLMATVSEAAVKNTADLDGEASSKIGAKIFGDYSHLLESNCQIGYRRHGESIVQVCCGSPYVARCRLLDQHDVARALAHAMVAGGRPRVLEPARALAHGIRRHARPDGALLAYGCGAHSGGARVRGGRREE